MKIGLRSLQRQIRNDNVQFVSAKFSFDRPWSPRRYDTSSAQLLGQKIIRAKDRGVEPGFIAKKIWTERDNEKLRNPNHKFYQEAQSYLQRGETEEHLVEHLVRTFPKFQKEHWWKLHYAEPKRGKVKIDAAQAKNAIHRLYTADTPRNKNIGALTEVLSNDIFTILGLSGQKLELKLSKYENGYPMFLLDGTTVMGPNGEPFQTLSRAKAIVPGPKYQGQIKDNMLPDWKGKLVPLDETKLGSALPKVLLLADRDKVGTYGDNIGYVVIDGKAVLMNIDPGKSLETPNVFKTDRMIGYPLGKKKCDIGDDCTFDRTISPKDLFTKCYPNFSIFNDTTLADRMQGVKESQEKWPQIVKLFDQYIAFFKENEALLDPNRPQDELPMHEELQAQFKRLQARFAMFCDVFKDRIHLSRDELNLIDNLEKLTSPTQKRKYLQIIAPSQNRTKWSIENGQLVFEAKSEQQFAKTASKISDFIGKRAEFSIEKIVEGKKIKGRVSINKDTALKLFTHPNIVEFKSF